MELKPWWSSKTVWINGLTMLLGIGTDVLAHVESGKAMTAMAIVNILIRLLTRKGLSVK